MTWLQRYRVRRYLQTSIWVLPMASMVIALGAIRLADWLDRFVGFETEARPEAARELLGLLASSIFALIVCVSSALLLAVQLASAQLTPRIIALVFRNPGTKLSLATFVFSFTFSLGALVRTSTAVLSLTTHVAALCCLLSLGLFLFLLDHVGRFLRPSGALRSVARIGLRVIEGVYPHRFDAAHITHAAADLLNDEPTFTVTSRMDGVILALDIQGLAYRAERFDCVIEMVPQVGDFVSAGEPLFRVFRGGSDLSPRALLQCVAVGPERTFAQDPAFAFRVIVDVASKALSPAINDPTTAVLAIDQVHYLLRSVGHRYLDEGRVRDAAGRLRLVYRTPDWEDFVQLAVTEIRQFGDESIQVARRLRAMLENLIQTLPGERAILLRQEFDVLRRSIERAFPEPEDRALAETSDLQGVGSKRTRSDGSARESTATLPHSIPGTAAATRKV